MDFERLTEWTIQMAMLWAEEERRLQVERLLLANPAVQSALLEMVTAAPSPPPAPTSREWQAQLRADLNRLAREMGLPDIDPNPWLWGLDPRLIDRAVTELHLTVPPGTCGEIRGYS
jgi:hypothetical protein